jgi:hypothetical protein
MSFSCLRAALGSMPSATSLRISSHRSRAFFNPTSGYTPSKMRFSLPAKRYLKRHQQLPVGAISASATNSGRSVSASDMISATRTT